MGEKIKMATREAYGRALAEMAAENKDLVVLDADLSKSTMTARFAEVAPERFFDCGIAEANMIGVAAGLATCGKIPFASSFAVFAAGRAFEQIRNSVCYPCLNVKIAATHAGVTVGEDGGSHQAIEDISLMRTLPNMTVLCPSDWVQAKWLVKQAAAWHGPVYLRLARLASVQIYEENEKFEWGKAKIVRKGSDIAIFACGMEVAEALKAAESLAAEGVEAAVIDVFSVKPLDSELIVQQSKACGAALTCEEASIIGGLGSAVAETLAEAGAGVPFSRVGMNDEFGQSGKPLELLKHYGLDEAGIAAKARAVLARKKI